MITTYIRSTRLDRSGVCRESYRLGFNLFSWEKLSASCAFPPSDIKAEKSISRQKASKDELINFMSSCTVVLAFAINHCPCNTVLRSSSIGNASFRMGRLWHSISHSRLLRRRSAKYSATPNALTPFRCQPALSWREPCYFNMWHGICTYVEGIDTGSSGLCRGD